MNRRPTPSRAAATCNGQTYTQGFASIGYPGIRPYPQYLPASDRLTGVDVSVLPGPRVAYIMGTGDEVPQALLDLGIHVTETLPRQRRHRRSRRLRHHHPWHPHVRCTAPELRTFNNRLLDFVKNGGVVITEYQTAEYDRNYGPYPISVPGDAEKVVEESSPVTLLKPDDPVLNYPNHITTADFDGWVEERGHGFPRTFDPRYIALTRNARQRSGPADRRPRLRAPMATATTSISPMPSSAKCRKACPAATASWRTC